VKRLLLAIPLACLAFGAAPASAATKTKSFTLGPVTVGPYQVKTGYLLAPKPPGNGYVTRMDVDVVDGPGPNARQVPISRLMLHHIVFVNLSRRDGTCGRFTDFTNSGALPAAERWYGAGEERSRLVLPPGYGYQFASRQLWGLTYMFMNHRNRVDRAYIRYNITWETTPQTPVKPYWLDVKNCRADPVYDVPGGRRRGATHRRSTTWTVPQAGRLVAGGGHVHGGAKNLVLRRKDCTDNRVYTSRPLWGNRDHPFYNVKPVLHEPGPINMSGFVTQRGIPLARGEKVVLDSRYDNRYVHTRVMGIMVVYMAHDSTVRSRCGGRPGDLVSYRSPAPGRVRPPPFKVPIVGIRNGVARNIAKPPGRRVRLRRRRTITVGDRFFRFANVSVRRGARLRWRFTGDELHNVTVANGPRGFSSRNYLSGNIFRKRLTKTGTYRLFCALHPVSMTGTVKVTRR
jgi:hypothetical protein